MQRDAGRCRNIQGIDRGGHRNPDDELGGRERGLLEAFALGPEYESDPRRLLDASTQFDQIHGSRTRR